MSTQARKAEVKIIYQGKNISQDIAPFLIDFTFNDNSGDKSDDISFKLLDRDSKWISDWFPSKGDKVQASIILHDWEDGDKTESMPCGNYEVDEISYSCPPRVLELKAVSAKISQPLCAEKHNKAWENVKISTICADIAHDNNLRLFFDAPEDFNIERREQSELSDLEFLKALAKDYGLNVKVNDDKLIIYDEMSYEEHESVSEIKRTDPHLINWKFTDKSAGTYKKAKVRYHDPVKNETIECECDDDDHEGCEHELEIHERVENEADARTRAKKRLHKANSKEVTGSITLLGDLRYLAGVNVTCTGFGSFDGKYMIESVTHKVTGGYTSSLNLKMGGESKKARKKKKQQRDSKPLYYTGPNYYGNKDKYKAWEAAWKNNQSQSGESN